MSNSKYRPPVEASRQAESQTAEQITESLIVEAITASVSFLQTLVKKAHEAARSASADDIKDAMRALAKDQPPTDRPSRKGLAELLTLGVRATALVRQFTNLMHPKQKGSIKAALARVQAHLAN